MDPSLWRASCVHIPQQHLFWKQSASILSKETTREHLKHLMAAATGIFTTAHPLLQYPHQSCLSQSRIHAAAPAPQRRGYRVAATCISSPWQRIYSLLLEAVGFEKAGAFFPRRNEHRAASCWCCHLGNLFLEKQEKGVGWAAKTMLKLKQADKSSVIKEEVKKKKVTVPAEI